mmetsp:Transcript_2497/g.6527  ORF Transcript_2497/g.6527 Transcript_2497/m.6527 type:complete len:522 (-) Transcript_2497:1843-3408(-)
MPYYRGSDKQGGGSVELQGDADPNLKDNPVETDSLLKKGDVESKIPLVAGESNDIFGAASGELERSTALEDAWDTLKLAAPIFVAMVSGIGMKTTDTALLGHVGAEALSASALSDLWTMCTGVLIQGRVLGILVGQAVGARNPTLAGIYLQVSYVVLSAVSLVVFASWFFTEQFWLLLGEGQRISRDAGLYAKILSLSIPANIARTQLNQFFQAQRIMYPEVIASTAGLALNLLLGLVFVLGVGIPSFSGWGFLACPTVTTIVVYIQIFLLWFVFCYIKGLHQPCWGGWSRKEITKERVWTYLELYVPAALGIASDFWRMGVIGTVAAKLGELEVAVFNTSYRLIWIALIMSSSVAGAAGIKLSVCLGKGQPFAARQAAFVGIAVAFGILTIVSILFAGQTRLIGRIFTADEAFLDMFEECSIPFVATLFFMNLSVAIERIPYSMGRTKEVFWMGFIASWGGQVPFVLLLTRYWRDDLTALYSGMAIGYFFLCILYSYITVKSDWQKYSDLAIKRAEKSKS